MDSLLATYASSDEEEDQPKPKSQRQPQSKPSSSLLSSLPNPQSSTPKFPSLPPPKFTSQKPETTPHSTPTPTPKRVVQFRPPLPNPPSNFNDNDEDEEDEEDRKKKKQKQLGEQVSVKSFLSSMPTPKNSGSLGSLPGSGRRSIVETEGPVPEANKEVGCVYSDEGNQQNLVVESNEVGEQGYVDYGGGSSSSYVSHGDSDWYNAAAVQVQGFAGLGGKRRKDQPPPEIIEVKQDELMKNRPTEDKSKLTGIAFGPSYQPASTKGKPSKQHKRKHQISALYFDMRQKELELSERRAKGFLTKAETQAKYGW